MRLFCDQCGEEFGENTLRADSKFCSYCGKALSTYIKHQSSVLFHSSPKSYAYEKKRKADDGEDDAEEDGGDVQAKAKGRPRKYPHEASADGVTMDESSTEENPESEETEDLVSLQPGGTPLNHNHLMFSLFRRNWEKGKGSAN
jgi:hypothetical protein